MIDAGNNFLFLTVFVLILINVIILYFVVTLWLQANNKPKPKSRTPAKSRKKPVSSAKNNAAVNAAVDYQKIKTAEIEIPVIAEDVLTYGPGELGPAYPETTNLYYPEAAISDPEYIESVLRSPLQVQTHEKNTGEYNRDVDGWPLSAWYDTSKKRVMVKGVVHGEDNVNYARENLTKPGFGTSAFISFLKIEKQKGTAPNGKPYDAIVKKAVNNHTAILPNIRDPKNVIVALNAVEKEEEGEKATMTEAVKSEIKNSEEKKMTQDEFNSMMDTYQAKNKEKDELKNSIKNEIMEELKKGSETDNAKNEDEPEKKEPEKKPDAENADDESSDDADASNALSPSEEMLKDFSTHLGVTFKTKPSLKALGKIVGVEAADTAGLISALNAKRKEITSGVEAAKSDAKNSQGKAPSLNDVLASI